MVFLILLLIPVLVALGFLIFSRHRVTLKEFFIHLGVMIVYTGICVAVIYSHNIGDTEHINGVVTAKRSERVSCRHPYCCMWCSSTSCDSKGHCTTTQYCCMTCYDHPYDVDWNVYSNIQRMWSIDTIDRQGLKEPPRWTATRVGEPVSWINRYDNYIKAAPGTLFKRDTRDDEKQYLLPERKVATFDYWRANQLYTIGVNLPDGSEWNREIEVVNGVVGPRKQANLVVVIVKDYPREYFEALQAKWLGGKKNDVVVVIGVDGELNVKWADVMAWSYNEMIRVEMRDTLAAMNKLDRTFVLETAKDNILRNFDRKHMKDFKYLTASFAPTGMQYFVSIFIGTLLSLGLGIWFWKQDVA